MVLALPRWGGVGAAGRCVRLGRRARSRTSKLRSWACETASEVDMTRTMANEITPMIISSDATLWIAGLYASGALSAKW